jgi:formylglycine-generating enzyme required for sulfatase activity/DNA polymerase III delta prime subunit
MDLATLIALFGPALWKVFETLLEKGAGQMLDKGFEPFKDWISSGYEAAKDEDRLRKVILAALDELKVSGEVEPGESLFAALSLTGLEEKTRLRLAACAVTMTRVAPSSIPADLLAALDLPEERRDLLARFLFALRRQLAQVEQFQDGLRYADQLEQLGLLRSLSGDMALVAERLEAISSLEEILIRERRLDVNDARALRSYLAVVREKWEGLMLPLLRKKSGDITSARLKQVFVPLALRDLRAEEEARRRMEKSRQPEKLLRDEAKTRPVEIGELLNRYPKFILLGPPGCGKTTLLSRVALAFAEGRATADLGWQGAGLFPIFLRLRNFGAFLKQNRDDYSAPTAGALVAYLENQFRDGERISLSADFFDRRLAEGNCLVLMDGLDEVSDLRNEVACHIDAFIGRYVGQSNRFGLASRPRGYESVEMQLRRSGLAVAEVNPLELSGIRQLIENLLTLIEVDHHLRATDLDNLTRAIGASEELTRIAGTPLFCSALVQVYKYHGARLPNRRVDVFDEIVDLLLGYWRAQQRHLSEAEQLAIEDGTGKQFREVKDAVAVKQRRLSYLAEHMQQARKAEIPKEEAESVLVEYLKARERVPNEETAQTWAENFLINSHERSGLLVERDPGIYSFLHKGFMEYLAASSLVNQKNLLEILLEHAEDEWWEQVILLAGAHPKLAEYVRSELVNQVLDQAETLPQGSEPRQRHLLLAGMLTRDMAEYLPGPEHERVEKVLYTNAVNGDTPAKQRADLADSLDELGYQPNDLHAFVPIPNIVPEGYSQSTQFLIAKYPVTNAQYARFLQPEDFENRAFWAGFPKFDVQCQPMKDTWGPAGWDWLQSALKDQTVENGVLLPPYWRDARFGLSRPHAPVVGVSWYEANAYCKWLLANWADLEEGQQSLPKPKEIRLPTEAEWVLAAGGGQDGRFAFGELKETKDLPRHANTQESGIRRTTPVWMYPAGATPEGLMDLSGNVFEWQANYRDKDHDVVALRGGSWGYSVDHARVSGGNDVSPNDGFYYVGFRVVVLALPN